MYSSTVLDHFQNPRNAGELPSSSASADVSNPVCGDVLRLAVRVSDGHIIETRFRAKGCVSAVAASSILTELMAGKTPGEARQISAEIISESLGGLPPATYHAAQLAADALRAVLASLSADMD
jgi:nitrogen fixation protein NifU and related proteins